MRSSLLFTPFLFTTGILVLLSAPVSGEIEEYSDRGAWQASAGTVFASEDFNGFVEDTPYGPGNELQVNGGMTLTGDFNTDSNRIDAPPLQNEESDVDGTSSARGNNGATPIYLFDTPISGFGADFAQFQDDQVRTGIEIYSQETLLTTLTPPVAGDVVRFYGFTANAGEQITEIRFVQIGPTDVFAVDNIELAATPVPTTSEWAQVALAGLLLLTGWAVLNRRRRAETG